MTRNPAFAILARKLKGEIYTPEDAAFEEITEIWNSRLKQRPAGVVRCLDTADVAETVKFAREQGIPLSIRSGGHSYAGLAVSECGLLLDLSLMKEIRIDRERKRAIAEPGIRWRELNEQVQQSGLGITGGTVSSVGIAGYTLGGGSGYLSRKFGLAIDNLLSVEMVTGSGRVVHASETENKDLFWALRGGGGNFGVVTRFEYRLHEVPSELFAGQVIYPFASAKAVLGAYRKVMAEAPDGLVCYPCMIKIPPIEAFPEDLHGTVAIDLVMSHLGPLEEGERLTAPLREAAEPIADLTGPMSYLDVHRAFDAGAPEGQRWYSKAHYIRDLSDGAIDTFLDHTRHLPGEFTFVYLEPMGGAVNRVDPAATAFPHRQAAFSFHILAGWSDPESDSTIKAWAQSFHQAMTPYASGGVYINLLSEDEPDRVPSAYGENYARLAEIKLKWDPENFFHRNQNILPAKFD